VAAFHLSFAILSMIQGVPMAAIPAGITAPNNQGWVAATAKEIAVVDLVLPIAVE
jgi:hypothetical protein